jgi:hypothetical protein
MGGGVEGYEVELDALDRASAVYHSQASVVKGHADEFRSKAALPAKAFGNLPESANLAETTQKVFDRVLGDIHTLAETLATGGERFSTSAANYRKAESASTID